MAKDQEKVEDQAVDEAVAEVPAVEEAPAPDAPAEDVATEEAAPAVPASDEVAAAAQEMMTVNLDTVITINGVSYGLGSVTVPAVVGEDLERMNADWLNYEKERNTRHNVSVNSGSINAGS